MSKVKLIVAISSALCGAIGVGKWIYDELKGRYFDEDGYNCYGFDKNGYDKDGYDEDGYNVHGIDADGYNKEGYNSDGFNRMGFDKYGYNRDGFDKYGYDRQGYNSNGYDKAGQNRDYYNSALKTIQKDLSNHIKPSLKYRYKMLDYRFTMEKLLRMIIEHYKGKEILESKDNDFLSKYIEIVYKEKMLDLTEDEKESIRLAKNYFGNFLHPKENSINGYKENKAIETVKMLYDRVQKKLDVRIAA